MSAMWASNLLERRGKGPQDTSALAYLALNLVTCCRFAAENGETAESAPDQIKGAVTDTLEVAEYLLALVIDGAEGLEKHATKASS